MAIKVPADFKAKLEEFAERVGWSQSECLRAAFKMLYVMGPEMAERLKDGSFWRPDKFVLLSKMKWSDD